MNKLRRLSENAAKRATNVSLSETLVSDEKALGVNVSRVCEDGLESEVRNERARRWQAENLEGFEAWNAYLERNGVPLAKYRKF